MIAESKEEDEGRWWRILMRSSMGRVVMISCIFDIDIGSRLEDRCKTAVYAYKVGASIVLGVIQDRKSVV